MPRRIVFINQATGYLTIDIINQFATEFDSVGVIYGDIRVQDTDLNPKVKKSLVIEKSRESDLKRFTRWSIATLQIFFLLLTKYRKYEIFYFSIPPFAYFSSLLLRRRFSVLMWDIYPDALKMAGISETSIVFRLWSRINRVLFKRAYRIYTIGEGLARILAKYVPAGKITVIPLWYGIKDFKPIPKILNPFIIEQDLKGKFIVQYSGNIGAGHNIESLIEVARLTRDDPEILYLIIGRGFKVNKVRDLIVNYGLTNCRLLPFQPDDMIKYSIAAADLSVVLIEDEIAQVSIPSKVYNIMAVGSPIVSIAPEISELSRMVGLIGNGRNFEKRDYTGLASFITGMKSSPEMMNSFREKSLAASKEFTSDNARKYYESYIS